MFLQAFAFEKNRFLYGILALALLGFLLVRWATVWGAGVSPDSVSYITGARGLIMGDGITYPDGGGRRHLVTLWPPLFSTVLALPGVADIDPASTGRFLNAVLFSVNIGLVGLIAWRSTGGSTLASLVAAGLFASSPDIVELHLWIWSEPLFIALTLVSILVCLNYLESRTTYDLLVAGLATGLAFLTRFAGAALAAAAFSMILLQKSLGTTLDRMKRAVAFGVLALTPMMLWMVRNSITSESALDRQIGFRRLYSVHFLPALDTAREWILPGLSVSPVSLLGDLLYGGFVCVLIVLFVLRATEHPSRAGHGRTLTTVRIVLAYLLAYGAVVLIAKVFIDPNFPFNDRILSPMLVTVILLIVILGHTVLGGSGSIGSKGTRSLRVLALFVGLAVAAQLFFALRESLELAYRARIRGLGYQSKSWQESLLVRSVESLPTNTSIFSNADDGLYFATGRPVWRLPEAQDSSEGEDRIPNWAVTMTSQMEGEQAYVVYFDAITWRDLVTPEDIAGFFDVSQILLVEEGVLAEIRPWN